ncbi:unnamed protein product, partial [Didymodactylos carnosus]
MIFNPDHQLRWVMLPNAAVKVDNYHSIISITSPTDKPKMTLTNIVIGTPTVESECIPIMILLQDKKDVLKQTNIDQDNMRCTYGQQQLQTRFVLNKYQNLFDTTDLPAIKATVHHTVNTGNHFPI